MHVASGGLTRDGVKELRAAKPDVVLLVGGTDGGNARCCWPAPPRLAKARWRGPVVVAGNVDARDEVAALLDGGGHAVRAGRQRRPADRRAGARVRAGARSARCSCGT